MRILIIWSAVVSSILVSQFARADVPFVVIYDNGALQENAFQTLDQFNDAANLILDQYLETDAPVPDVMSVWPTFPLGSSSLWTMYLPLGNDIEGIGLETVYGGNGTMSSPMPPLRTIMLHNDVTDMEARAERHDAPVEGYAQYLFLLELSHAWGPAIQLPTDPADALIGFTFHWTFWLDSGGSPAGGNRWNDNGDGTFTTLPLSPSEVCFSAFDLYLMGLIDASDVEPLGVIRATDVPPTTDPINGGQVSASTFPWFSETPLTVTGQMREATIDAVIEANGPRNPPFGEAPTEMSLGVVLIVPADTEEEEELELMELFAEVAGSLAPSYARATEDRGSLDIVTWTVTPGSEPEPDGGPFPDAGPDADVQDADALEPDADNISEDAAPPEDAAPADAEVTGTDGDAGIQGDGRGEGCACSPVGAIRRHRARTILGLLP